MTDEVTTGEIVVGALQVGGGAIAALGAWWAMRAAQASQATSRDAAQALALHLRPEVTANLFPRWTAFPDHAREGYVTLTVQSAANDASDVVVEVVRRDGRRHSYRTERLVGFTQARMGEQLMFVERLEPNPDLDHYLPNDMYESVTVSFSDTQGLARWTRGYRVLTREQRLDPTMPVLAETGLMQIGRPSSP